MLKNHKENIMAGKKYHINPETGRPNQCTATVRGCKYAVDGEMPEHYDSKEDARKAYEKIAAQEYGEVKSLSKNNGNSESALKVEGFPNFDANTAEPVNFDEVSAEVYERYLDADFKRDRAYRAIQMRANPKKYNPRTGRSEYTLDGGKVLAEFRNKANPDPSEKRLIEQWETAEREATNNMILRTKLDRVYRKRGAWNRAYLVPDGHLHKSMDCSTCNKGDTPTKFQWMTDYSAKNEKEIVGAAGYRACTTCYPTAPVGNAESLPSKMMTDSEREKAKEQSARKEELAKKKVDAANKAPTVDGKPLRIKDGRYDHDLKTERAASQWYVSGVADGPSPNRPEEEEQKKQDRYKILYNLALKNDVSIKELKDELDNKAMAKSKRDYKASEKHFASLNALNAGTSFEMKLNPYEEPVFDTYDVPDELLNKSPREWENANKYIPQ